MSRKSWLLACLVMASASGCGEEARSPAASRVSRPAAQRLVEAPAPVMVKDIGPGSTDTFYPASMRAFGGTLYFRGKDSAGAEVWKSDGTEAGTVLVNDTFPGSGNGEAYELTDVNGTIFFRGTNGTSGFELWKTDGTAAGTTLVKDILPSNDGSPKNLLSFNGELAFFAYDGVSSYDLWKSNGTEAGTVRVKDLGPPGNGSGPTNLLVVNGMLFFAAPDASGDYELWKSDGTEAGTVRVKDIRAGASSSPTALTAVGQTLFFRADDGQGGAELWKSDGTEAGTVRVKDIHPGTPGSNITGLTAVGGTLFFSALDGTHGTELWKSDGTEAGTVLVKDIRTGSATASGSPLTLTRVGSTLFFKADDGVSGFELWKSDGTEAGTVRVADIHPGIAGSEPDFIRDIEGVAYFRANNGTHGVELWRSDGTAEGTVLVADLAQGTASSTPKEFVYMGDSLYFVANDGVHGSELWRLVLAPPPDTTPPVVTCPGAQTAEATSAQGAAVNYPPATAQDETTAEPTLSYSHARGSVFPLTTTEVTATAKDEAGNTASCTFTVTVKDTTPPTLTCPEDVTKEATSASGAVVNYPPASASDVVSEALTVTYSQESGTAFSRGPTTINVTAKDGAGNSAACSFTVTVGDPPPPSITCPENVTVEATSATGALATYSPASATGLAPVSVSYSRDSGEAFPLAATLVTATARDALERTATCTFTVTVQDTTPPDLGCPAALTAEAVDATGANVVFSAPAPRDTVTRTPTVSLSHAPGSRFPLGSTEVRFTAQDEAGNTSQCTFTVTVRDTTAPALTCPADVTVKAPRSQGATVEYAPATTSDGVSPPVLQYSQASGSEFPQGTTPVTVTATDAAGNAASCTFQVTVQPRGSTSVDAENSAALGCGAAPGAAMNWGWSGLLLLGWAVARRRA